MPPAASDHPTEHTLLVFRIGEQLCALPVEDVREIVPIAQLTRPPGLPTLLEGFLNLRGTAVPVLRLDRLFDLPRTEPQLHTPLIVLRDESAPSALLAGSVLDIVSVPAEEFLPIQELTTFNNCAEAQVAILGTTVSVLSCGRLLLEKERQSVTEFQARAQQYLQELEAADA